MLFETREQVFEKVMSMEKPKCPHCENEMSIWEVPPINFSDGLGWGVPYLFVCFNDECSLYKGGWEHLKDNYAHTASYRCMNYPGTKQFELMPVFSPVGATGQVIDDQVLLQQEALKENIKKGFSILAECFASKNAPTALSLLLDPAEPMRVRIKAAEIIGDIAGLDAIEPLRNLKIGNDILQKETEKALENIHTRHFTRECPLCAEIIKKRAKICKHCGKDVGGK
jgi:hypothetical protein